MSNKRFDFPETVPLHHFDGSVRVIGSRITLDTLVARFEVGDTLEEIQDGFPSLTLTQIEAVIDWYLNHRAEADEYLREREAEAEKFRMELESKPSYIALSEKIRSILEKA